jgi:glucose-fructose oxidoreductase
MSRRRPRSRPSRPPKVRYAVVGLGHIAQVAVLPAFAHAHNSELRALVSDDPVKRRELSRRYGVERAVGYDGYDELLRSGEIDAVYVALPNDLHRDYTERAAAAGIHVLVEKPMALTEADCLSMIRAAEGAGVRLMVAYRLHFDEATLSAVELVRSGRIGDARLIESALTMQVREGDIRVQRARGGGPLYDIGIYCINASRYLFRDEPIQVFAFSATPPSDPRFREVEETVCALLRFPGDRLATWMASFGVSQGSHCRIIGTEGELRMEPSFDYADDLVHHLRVGERRHVRRFPKRDQFAPELITFSDCIRHDRDPESSGWEGLADARVIDALNRSLRSGAPVELPPFARSQRPDMSQELRRPPVRKPEVVRAPGPHP